MKTISLTTLYLTLVYAVVVLIATQLGLSKIILYTMGIIGIGGMLVFLINALVGSVKKMRFSNQIFKPVFNLNIKK